MFPALTQDLWMEPKDYGFALRGSGIERAWPLDLFSGGRVIIDAAGFVNIVLVGHAATPTVRAYRRDTLDFTAGPDPGHLRAHRQDWRITEATLVAPDGRQLDRLPGHTASGPPGPGLSVGRATRAGHRAGADAAKRSATKHGADHLGRARCRIADWRSGSPLHAEQDKAVPIGLHFLMG